MHHDKSHHAARWGTVMVAVGALVTITGLGHIQTSSQPPARPAIRPLPQALIFEQNPGQHRERIPYRARGADYDIHISAAGVQLSLRDKQLGIRPLGARQDARPAPGRPLATRHHYLLGRDPAAWRTRVPTYGEVRYRQLYPGIDLVYYGREGRLEYDFVIAPQADPGLIRLAFEGAGHIAVNQRGELLLQVGKQRLVQPPPHIYQELAGERRVVAGGYAVNREGEVSFRLAAYDRQQPLIIDPVLVYASYLGGASDERAMALAVDASGNIYLAGSTDSADLASGGAFDGSCGSDGDCDSEALADIGTTVRKSDIFVTKLAPDGSVIYTTYLGGGRADLATDLAVNAAGEVYVSGYTQATDYPVTAGAFDSACSDALPAPGGDGICDEGTEAVITHLASDGATLIYSTYLGGDGDDFAHALALDTAGNAYVTGSTASSDFPTVNPFAATFSGHQDVFVAKLNPAGSALVYATYLGGADSDVARDIAVDTGGSAYVTGYTASQDFPFTPGALDTSCGASGLCDGLVDDDGDGNNSTIT
ncbi:MAG: SBBP repeat-containing protein, partial [Gammaproteobacteria bacterium]